MARFWHPTVMRPLTVPGYRKKAPSAQGSATATGLQDHNIPVRGGHVKFLVLRPGHGQEHREHGHAAGDMPITGLPATYERLGLTFLPLMHTERGAEAA